MWGMEQASWNFFVSDQAYTLQEQMCCSFQWIGMYVCIYWDTVYKWDFSLIFCTVRCKRQEPPDSNCLQEEDAVKFKKKIITFSVKDKKKERKKERKEKKRKEKKRKENLSYNEENCEDTWQDVLTAGSKSWSLNKFTSFDVCLIVHHWYK